MKKIKSRFIVSFLTVMTCVVASLSAEEKSADEIAMELGNPASNLYTGIPTRMCAIE